MRTTTRVLAGAALGAGAAVLLLPGAAYADNCGSMSDCYYTARAALAALVGLSVLFGVLLSIGLDFVPVVGTVKGVIEAITGKDLITGQELAWWERLLGIVPVVGGIAGVAAGISRAPGPSTTSPTSGGPWTGPRTRPKPPATPNAPPRRPAKRNVPPRPPAKPIARRTRPGKPSVPGRPSGRRRRPATPTSATWAWTRRRDGIAQPRVRRRCASRTPPAWS
ncbi:pre-toxin TG domain-containing protein [Catellatospora coxensis]